MTLQISPVLAGTYDATNYPPPVSNAAPNDVNADEIDSRRYTKFDRSATEAGTMTDFSFGDFLDMINPLEHIPLVSSIYREICGDKINPVAETVGNIVYGGVTGVASAVVGVLGSITDAVFEQSGGKSTTGTVVAALFGDDDKTAAAKTQLAQANAASPSVPAQAAAQAVAPAAIQMAAQPNMQMAQQTNAPRGNTPTAAQINARAKLQAAAIVAATSASTQASMPSSGTSSPAAQMAASSSAGSGLLDSLNGNPATALPFNSPKSYALDPKKLPYGGVMAPPLQGNNMAVALSNSAPGMQMNHTVYTGRTFNGIRPTAGAAQTATAAQASTTAPAPAQPASTAPVASATPPATANANAQSDAYVSTAAPDQLPPALMNDIAALRAINTYRNTASQTGAGGSTVNVIN